MNGHGKQSEGLHLEKAYCHYRLNNLQEARRILESVPSRTSAQNELFGQVLYRLEEYGSSLKLYRDLMRHTQDDFGDEREANVSAVLVGQLSQSPNSWDEELTSQLRTNTYELCYNNACMLLYRGQATEAEATLHKAEDLCRKSLQEDEDFAEEEIEDELAVIRVQRAYALQVQGKVELASKLYTHVLKSKPHDVSLTAVASNNTISINKDHDLFDSAKKAKALTADVLAHKLTQLQKQAMLLNRCLLFLYTNQTDQMNNLVKKLDQSTDLPCLLLASQAYKERRVQNAIQLLQGYIAQHPASSLRAQLSLAQIYLSQGPVEQACDVLLSLSSLQHSLGMVSTLIAMYQIINQTEKAKEVLDGAVSFWKQRKMQGQPAPFLPVLLEKYSAFLLRYYGAREATSVLEDLRKEKPTDLRVLAQLISTYSQFNAKQAEEYLLRLHCYVLLSLVLYVGVPFAVSFLS
jgi:signal recognition particle subunit SRP72